jgi:hypothetical protein
MERKSFWSIGATRFCASAAGLGGGMEEETPRRQGMQNARRNQL